MKKWTDIVDISMGDVGSIAGLKSDGTVVVSKRYSGSTPGEDYFDAAKWTDIVAISAGQNFHVGLKSDGTLVVAGACSDGWTLDVSDITGLYVPSVDLSMD